MGEPLGVCPSGLWGGLPDGGKCLVNKAIEEAFNRVKSLMANAETLACLEPEVITVAEADASHHVCS